MTQTKLTGTWQNHSKETIPGYGIVRVIGTDIGRDGSLIYLCDVPNGKPGLHVVNQNVPIMPRRYGTYFTESDPIHPLLLDASRVPAVGERCGPQPKKTTATLNSDGWQVLATTRSQGVVIVTKSFAPLQAIVKLKDDIDEDDFGDVILMSGPKSAETVVKDANDEDVVLELVYNRFSDLKKDAVALATYFVNGWEIFAGKCEE